jgi:hypothetical protein
MLTLFTLNTCSLGELLAKPNRNCSGLSTILLGSINKLVVELLEVSLRSCLKNLKLSYTFDAPPG